MSDQWRVYVETHDLVCTILLIKWDFLKELPRVNKTYDPVFNLLFALLENMGVVLYNKGY